MLHGDRAERRERRRLMEHALGQVRVEADALPLAGSERAGLVPDRVRDAEPPEVVDEPGAAQRAHLAVREAELYAGRRLRARRPRRAWPSVYGDFRSTKFAIASSAVSTWSPESTTASAGSASITASQVPTESSPARIVSLWSQTICASSGSNCLPLRARATSAAASTPPTRFATSTNSAICASLAASGTLVARELARPAASVPLLVGAAERRRARRRTARAARRARGPCRRGGRSSRSRSLRPESANSSPSRKRCSGGLPAPIIRIVAAAAPTLRIRVVVLGRLRPRCRRRTTSPARGRRCGSRR